MRRLLRIHREGQRGQTTIEYLMLIAAATVTALIIVNGPLATYTGKMLSDIRGSLGNLVRNGELSAGAPLEAGQAGHPSDGARMKALHL